MTKKTPKGNSKKEEFPFINCHTHIFTHKAIPWFVGRKFVPGPLVWMSFIPLWFGIYRIFIKLREKVRQGLKLRDGVLGYLRSSWTTIGIYYFILIILLANFLYFFLNEILNLIDSVTIDRIVKEYSIEIINWFGVFISDTLIQKIVTCIAFVIFYPQFIKVALLLLKQIFKPLMYLPKKETIEFLKRYLNIAELTKYKNQYTIYERLERQYDPGTKFIVLPMDMEYMGAGRTPKRYRDQIHDIVKMKSGRNEKYDHMIPFLFVDPRRIRNEKRLKKGDKPFFSWEPIDGKVVLKDSLFRDCFEQDHNNAKSTGHFKGVKIYPALGYFPFDKDLLPIYQYCIQNNIPVLTHCVKGTIFYRGTPSYKWQIHPIFKGKDGNSLKTYAKNNYDLQVNFTHPLNYLCLLNEELFVEVLEFHQDGKLNQLFSYNRLKRTSTNLNQLTINLAHYGGKEEWNKYNQDERGNYSKEIIENPDWGIDFFHSTKNNKKTPSKDKVLEIWEVDWYAIISSLMIQYDNVYADISYILHAKEMHSTLLRTMENPILRDKILFGTDYFVVRNHNSERELYSDMLTLLGKTNLDVIGRTNTSRYLKNVKLQTSS